VISIKLQPFYETKGPTIPGDTPVRIECFNQKSREVIQTTDSDFDTAKQGIEFVRNNFQPGDYRIRCRLLRDDGELVLLEGSFSVFSDLELQVAKMEQVQRDKSMEFNSSVRATLNEYLSLIQQGQEPFSAETDYPFFQILELANRIVERPRDAPSQIGDAAKINDVWMVLTEGRKRVPVRLRAPQNKSGKLPVLFLFHGAGGSENMFFETYGAGQAVKMGLDRGWLVVAPRQGLMGMPLNCEEMLNALESFFDIDRTQVFLLGHSMGAAQVIQQAGMNPTLPTAAAAIGGGRPSRDAAKLARIPWFVSAGEADFGRSGAKAFHESLIKAGAAKANYVELPGVEHLVIVQAVLPQAFEFFDQSRSK
jgi:predicted esterase